MGERKVLNKHYPADYDPGKVPRRKKPEQMKVRMMLPMSIRCDTCGDFTSKGKKFNSWKKDVIGKTYLGIKLLRFYSKCPNCSAVFTYKTDPKNSDYAVESGAKRTSEPWRAQDEAVENEKRKQENEEMGDAMKSLENRSLDSKREMDILASLDELKSMKSRQATVTVDAMLEVLQRANEEKEEKLNEEDEALMRSLFQGSSDRYIRRINDEDIDDFEDLALGIPSKRRKLEKILPGNPTDILTITSALCKDKATASQSSSDGKFSFKSAHVRAVILKKPPSDSKGKIPVKVKGSREEVEPSIGVTRSNCLQLLCQQYGNGCVEDD